MNNPEFMEAAIGYSEAQYRRTGEDQWATEYGKLILELGVADENNFQNSNTSL